MLELMRLWQDGFDAMRESHDDAIPYIAIALIIVFFFARTWFNSEKMRIELEKLVDAKQAKVEDERPRRPMAS